MAGGGGGSNTTHALLSQDTETLPIGGVFRPATGQFLGTKMGPRPANSGFLCSLNSRFELPSDSEIWLRHYPLGVGS